jgi:putative flippase GtrA
MKYINSEFIRYVAVGLVNTALTYGVFVLCLRLMPYQVAYTVAYVLGIGTSYVLQSWLAFREPLSWKKAIQYPGVYVVQYILGLFFLSVLVTYLMIAPEIASLVNIVLTIPITFFLTHYIIKKKPISDTA